MIGTDRMGTTNDDAVRRAHALAQADEPTPEMLAASEHQVFEPVSEAGLTRLFVFRSDVIPEIDRDDGRFVVFVDNEREAIGQRESLAGDFEV